MNNEVDLKNEKIYCPCCLSKDVKFTANKDSVSGYFNGLCSCCGQKFDVYVSPIKRKVHYVLYDAECCGGPDKCKEPEKEKCCSDTVGRSSEDYEREIDHLKHENARLFTAVENLNNTIRILIENVRKG